MTREQLQGGALHTWASYVSVGSGFSSHVINLTERAFTSRHFTTTGNGRLVVSKRVNYGRHNYQGNKTLRRFIPFILLLTLLGCSDFPELEGIGGHSSTNAAYPRILPLQGLLASVPAYTPGLGVGDLPTRAASLRARAAGLRNRAVIDAATRARMQAALARHR